MDKKDKIEEIFSKTIDISPHMQVAIKVINLLRNDYVSIEEIDEFLSRDKVFTARFLKIANSPYYGMRKKIKTVKDALILIGLDTAKALIFATSTRYLYKNFGSFEQKLWEHSLGVGICASFLSVTTGFVVPELGLACGILHDLGKIFIYNAKSDIYPRIYEELVRTKKSSVELEDEILGFNHTDVGAFVAEKWNYPDEIKKAIQYHHTFPYPNPEERLYKDICNIIVLSDQICLDLGVGFKRDIPSIINYASIDLDENSLNDLKKLFLNQFNEQKKFLLE